MDFKYWARSYSSSVIQKVSYDRTTDDQKKAVQTFELGEDVFYRQKATVHHEALGLHNRTNNSNSVANYPTTMGE